MKEEIKEILEVKENVDYKKLSVDEIVILEDYITNLQEKLEDKLVPDELVSMLNQELVRQNQDYKQRNEKAIEYINENKHLSMFADCREPEEDWNYDLEINPRELLNILKGDKDE